MKITLLIFIIKHIVIRIKNLVSAKKQIAVADYFIIFLPLPGSALLFVVFAIIDCPSKSSPPPI